MAQYAYQVDPVVRPPIPDSGFVINGVTDILSLSSQKLLFIERSFSTGKANCNVRVYEGDLSNATDINKIPSLKNQTYNPVSKKLIFNLDSLQRNIGNIEGVSFGPRFPNGHLSLIFVSDNNFRESEKTQFVLFEIISE
jgi:hypothetical protein